MIVLFGATGSIGPRLVRNLLIARARVRVVARDPAAARAKLGSDIEIVHGDATRAETLPRALEGATSVFDSVGGASGTRQLAAAVTALIDAARKAGVRRYLHVSGVRSRVDARAEIQRVHGEIEAYLAGSGLDATVLRGNFFFQNFLGLAPAVRAGVLALPTGAARAALVDARDIADVAAAVLGSEDHAGRTYSVTGPAALTHSDAAEIFSRVLGRPVTFADVPARAFERSCAQAGLPDWFAFWLADVYEHAFAAGEAEEVTSIVETLTGRRPRSLEAFVNEHRVAFE